MDQYLFKNNFYIKKKQFYIYNFLKNKNLSILKFFQFLMIDKNFKKLMSLSSFIYFFMKN